MSDRMESPGEMHYLFAIPLVILIVVNFMAALGGAMDGFGGKDCTPNRRGLWLVPAYPAACWLASPWDNGDSQKIKDSIGAP